MTSNPSARDYRKKPVTIQAMQWDGTALGATPIIDWILANGGSASYYAPGEWDGGETQSEYIVIRTLEGMMLTSPGDYVIRGVQGEFYPCKPDIFAATYETMTSNPSALNGENPGYNLAHAQNAGVSAIDGGTISVFGRYANLEADDAENITCAVLTAALPHIEKQIRAQAAADIWECWDACGDLIDGRDSARQAIDAIAARIAEGDGE